VIGLGQSDVRPKRPSRNSVRRDTAKPQYDRNGALLNVASADGEAAALALDEFSTSALREFFELLDRWDREGGYGDKTM